VNIVKRVILFAVMLLATAPANAAAWDTRDNPSAVWDCGTYLVDIQYSAMRLGEYQRQTPGDFALTLVDIGYGVVGWKERGLSIPDAEASYIFNVINMESYNELTFYVAYDKNTIALMAVSGSWTTRDRTSLAEALAETLSSGKPPRVLMDGDRRICSAISGIPPDARMEDPREFNQGRRQVQVPTL